MGETKTALDVVYDTGSDWLVIPDKDCFACLGTRFDSSESEVLEEGVSQRLYGSAALEGRTYTGKACLTMEEDSCVDEFGYFAFHN